jgi:hypothetical protein
MEINTNSPVMFPTVFCNVTAVVGGVGLTAVSCAAALWLCCQISTLSGAEGIPELEFAATHMDVDGAAGHGPSGGTELDLATTGV